MNEFSHASIIPLIGGEAIGSEMAFGSPPIHFMSYTPFIANDSHIINYYGNVPYYLLDKGQAPKDRADVVSSVCPCAGLSLMSQGYGEHNENNKWLTIAADYVLSTYKPKVYWGENSSNLVGKLGKPILENMKKIGRENGYTMSVYRTQSLLHGVPQVRERSFYFFWKGNKTPVLNYFNRPYTPIEDLIRNVKSNFQQEPINKKTPSKNPYYKFILEKIHGGMSHREYSHNVKPGSVRNIDVFSYIERAGYNYKQVGEWLNDHGHPEEVEKCERKYTKLASGGSIMRRGVIIPKDYIGAFVGQYTTMLTHPDEDRFITYREAMSIMGLPENFELVNANQTNANHICQNVPVQAAADMAAEVVEYLKGNRLMIDTDYILQYNKHKTIEFTNQTRTIDGFFND